MHNKKKERKSMSEVVVGLLGFACIVAIVVTLFKSKTLPSIAFIIFPMILGVILVFGGYYSWLKKSRQTLKNLSNQKKPTKKSPAP